MRSFISYFICLIICTPSLAQVVLKEKVKLQEESNIRSVAFTANSKRLVAGGDKGTVQVYEILNKESWSLPSHSSKVSALATSYDNRYVATASEDGSLLVYDFQESKSIKVNGASGMVKSITFSPTGRTMATGNSEGKISIWDLSTREKTATFQGRVTEILALAYAPDGKWLASGASDNSVLLWNTETAALANSFTGHKDWVRAVSFNPKGNILASGSYDNNIKLWNVTTGEAIGNLIPHRSWVTDVHYSPDGQYIASASANGEVVILETYGKIVQKLKGFGGLVSSISFSFDGKWLAVAYLNNTISLFDCTALHITPWKPYDVTPPSIVVLSPKLLSTKDKDTGFRKAVVHQPTVRLLLEVSDLTGVREVLVDGKPVEADAKQPDRFPLEFTVPLNSEKVVTLKVSDLSGNVAEDKLIIEHKRFSGSVDADKYHALLIANQDYADPSITDLDQPLKDMERLKEVLLSHYSFKETNVEVLSNPDRASLYAKFDELQTKMDKFDNLLVFYAGHGYWDEQLGQGYWLPSDAVTGKRSTWLSNSTLRDYIAGIGSRHTLLITDACFSGGIFKSRAVFENATTAIEALYLRKSRKAMTSGTLEKVPDKSVFMEALIEKLAENNEPYISAEEIFSGIRREVIEKSPNNQIPQYGEVGQTGDEGGEFIFVRKK